MTPDGQFRDAPVRPRAGWLDRVLGRVGGVALLVTLAAGGLVLAVLAFAFVTLLLPILIGAAAVAFGALWWRVRRLKKQMAAAGYQPPPGAGAGPQAGATGQAKIRFTVIRR
jgi:hypothetical protein